MTIADLENNTVLVTGADGFVGRHLVKALVGEGADVRAVDLQFEASLPDGAQAIIADVQRIDDLRAAMEGVDIVYHLAAVSDLWVSTRDPGRHHRVNVDGTRNVLQAAIDTDARRFVHCSSNVVLIAGRRAFQHLDEDHTTRRSDLFGAYARSKFDAAALVQAAGGQIETVRVLPGTPIGPGDHRPTPPGRFLRDLVNGAIPALPRGAAINAVDVRVMTDTIARSGYLAPAGSRYLLTGCDVTFGDLARIAGDLTGLTMPRAVVPYGVAWTAALAEDVIWSRWTGRMPAASFDGLRMAGRARQFSNARARQDLLLEQTDLRACISDALTWMMQNGMITRPMPGLGLEPGSVKA